MTDYSMLPLHAELFGYRRLFFGIYREKQIKKKNKKVLKNFPL